MLRLRRNGNFITNLIKGNIMRNLLNKIMATKLVVALKRWLCGFWRKIAYHIDGEFSLLKIEMWDGFSFEILCYENGNWSGSLTCPATNDEDSFFGG